MDGNVVVVNRSVPRLHHHSSRTRRPCESSGGSHLLLIEGGCVKLPVKADEKVVVIAQVLQLVDLGSVRRPLGDEEGSLAAGHLV
jgi:hypothetical protein